jgi:hypothetical protein
MEVSDIFSSDFDRRPRNKTSRKCVQWEPSSRVLTEELVGTFRDFANAPEKTMDTKQIQ